jgi:hypothetical protein
MGRLKNSVDSKQLTLSVTPAIYASLERLSVSGYYGKNPSETAAEILREKLREMFTQPGLPGFGVPAAAPVLPTVPGLT